jgi:hypothetical protein
MTADPFARYRIDQGQSSNQSKTPKPIQPDQNDAFSKYRIGKPGTEEETATQYLTRNATRIGSRVAEQIGGIPGDFAELIEGGVFSGLESIFGHKVTPEMREEARIRSERPPSSSELQKLSEETTKGYTSPKDEKEKIADEYTSTVANLLGPMKFRKALGVAALGTAAKKGTEILGLGQGAQEASKLGTMIVSTMINPKGASKFAASQYEKANNLAKGASINASTLEKSLSGLNENLMKGISTNPKNMVLKASEDVLSKVKNGKIGVDELTAAKRDINTLMGDPALLKREKILLKSVGKFVDQTISQYEKVNPEFKKAYRPANEIYGAIAEGNKASKFIQKTIGPKSVLGAIVGETVLGHPEAIIPTVGIVGLSHGGAATVDFLTRLGKSKELRKYYRNALSSALKEDSRALIKYENLMQKAMKNESIED